MSSNEYHVDVNLVIDGTCDTRPVIDGVKNLAGEMHTAIFEGLKKEQKHVDKLRVGITVFRDFGCDGANALVSSGFFTLPDDEGKLKEFMAPIYPMGGGDEPNNSLEALAFALQGNWTNEGMKQRHVTILFTDASPHPYGAVSGPGKPAGLPASIDEVLDIWRGTKQDVKLRQNARRLYLVVPKKVDAYKRWEDEECVSVMEFRDVITSAEAARSHIVSTIVNSI